MAEAATTQIVHFTVEGEFVMEKARALWTEGLPDKALKLIRCLQGITYEQALSVLEGRAKLTGDSNTGIGMEPDDTKMPTLAEILQAQREAHDDARDEVADLVEMAIGEVVGIPSPGGLREVPRRKTERAGLAQRSRLRKPYNWEEILEPGEKPVRIYRERDDVFPARKVQVRKTKPAPAKKDALQDIADRWRILLDDARPIPPPSPEKTITSNTGWLSRDGKFYPCRWMEHVSMAIRLGDEEGSLERKGWVKLAMHNGKQMFWGFFEPEPPPTDDQRRMVGDYCTANGLKLPYWMRKGSGLKLGLHRSTPFRRKPETSICQHGMSVADS